MLKRLCISAVVVLALAHGAATAQTAPNAFESSVPLTPTGQIDKLVFAKLSSLGIKPVLCSDAVFVRRAYLDVIGTLPTAQEAKAFIDDPDTKNKRRKLIDRLLARPEFADYWAMKWGDRLRIKAEFPVNLWPNAAQAYHRWVRASIDQNKPYDKFVRELLTSSGSNFRVGPVNFYRAVQNRTPEGITAAVALAFMGSRVNSWPKERLTGMTAFFSQVGYKPTSEWKEQIVFWDPTGFSTVASNSAPGRPNVAKPPKRPKKAAKKRPAKPPKKAAKPAVKPLNKATAKAAAKPAAKTAAKPAAKPPRKTAAKPAAESTKKAAAKPAAKPAKQATAKPAAKPPRKTAAKPPAKPAEKTAAKPGAKPSGKAAAKPTAKPAGKTAAKPVANPAKKVAAKPAAKPTDKTAAAPVKKVPRVGVFPDGTKVKLPPNQDPREIFADWLITPKNPWFARNIVNRVWSWLLGRGIIHEPDDIRKGNPPSNPALLAYLEREFVSSGYDMKRLYRLILTSTTYQLSSVPRFKDPKAAANFASYPLRRLEAEVLIDAVNNITGTFDLYTSAIPEPFTYIPKDMPAVAVADGSITSPFLTLFGRSARATGMENERSNKPVPGQWLHMLNSSHIRMKLERGPKLLAILRARRKPDETVEVLYLTILSRRPAPEELKTLQGVGKLIKPKGAPKGRPAKPVFAKTQDHWLDIAWALINTNEFLYRH